MKNRNGTPDNVLYGAIPVHKNHSENFNRAMRDIETPIDLVMLGFAKRQLAAEINGWFAANGGRTPQKIEIFSTEMQDGSHIVTVQQGEDIHAAHFITRAMADCYRLLIAGFQSVSG